MSRHEKTPLSLATPSEFAAREGMFLSGPIRAISAPTVGLRGIVYSFRLANARPIVSFLMTQSKKGKAIYRAVRMCGRAWRAAREAVRRPLRGLGRHGRRTDTGATGAPAPARPVPIRPRRVRSNRTPRENAAPVRACGRVQNRLALSWSMSARLCSALCKPSSFATRRYSRT